MIRTYFILLSFLLFNIGRSQTDSIQLFYLPLTMEFRNQIKISSVPYMVEPYVMHSKNLSSHVEILLRDSLKISKDKKIFPDNSDGRILIKIFNRTKRPDIYFIGLNGRRMGC